MMHTHTEIAEGENREYRKEYLGKYLDEGEMHSLLIEIHRLNERAGAEIALLSRIMAALEDLRSMTAGAMGYKIR